jgi:hypothetical protein
MGYSFDLTGEEVLYHASPLFQFSNAEFSVSVMVSFRICALVYLKACFRVTSKFIVWVRCRVTLLS